MVRPSVRHARTAIDIVQRCAVYFKRPHENICVSIVTCFFDTLNYFSEFRCFFGHFITTILVLCYCFSMSSTNTQSAASTCMIEQATVWRRTEVRLQGGESETELVVSSTTQGSAKNAIKIDILLTRLTLTIKPVKLNFL